MVEKSIVFDHFEMLKCADGIYKAIKSVVGIHYWTDDPVVDFNI